MNKVVFEATQVVMSSTKPFEQVIQAIESMIGQMPIERLAQLLESSPDWAAFAEGVKARTGTSGFMSMSEFDFTLFFSKIPLDKKARLYLIGNPLIARQMLEQVIEAGQYVPPRLYVYEDDGGTTHLAFDKLAPVIERFGNEAVTAVARMVDEKLEELVRAAAN